MQKATRRVPRPKAVDNMVLVEANSSKPPPPTPDSIGVKTESYQSYHPEKQSCTEYSEQSANRSTGLWPAWCCDAKHILYTTKPNADCKQHKG